MSFYSYEDNVNITDSSENLKVPKNPEEIRQEKKRLLGIIFLLVYLIFFNAFFYIDEDARTVLNCNPKECSFKQYNLFGFPLVSERFSKDDIERMQIGVGEHARENMIYMKNGRDIVVSSYKAWEKISKYKYGDKNSPIWARPVNEKNYDNVQYDKFSGILISFFSIITLILLFYIVMAYVQYRKL